MALEFASLSNNWQTPHANGEKTHKNCARMKYF